MKIVDCGIDWLQTTVRPCEGLQKWVDVFEEEIQLSEAEGGKRKRRTICGYDGWTANGVWYGSGPAGFMFQATSQAADVMFPKVMDIDASFNVPRLDVQFTVHDPKQKLTRPIELLFEIEATRKREKKGRRRKFGIDADIKEADTLSVNSRGGPSYGRYYDAHAVHPRTYKKGSVRLECEYRNKLAREYFERFRKAPDKGKQALSTVVSQFHKWNVPLDIYDLTEIQKLPSTYRKTDTHKRIFWLADQVRQAIDELEVGGNHAIVAYALNMRQFELKQLGDVDYYSREKLSQQLTLGVMSGSESDPVKEMQGKTTLEVAKHSREKKKLSRGGMQ